MYLILYIIIIFNQYILVDSSGNAFTLSSQIPECVAYNPYVDAIQIANRSYNPTGCVNVHQSPSDLSWWSHDYAVYNLEFGPSLQPMAIASDFGQYDRGPHICHAAYAGGIGYRSTATYQSGSWYSGSWDFPTDLFIEGARQCLGKQLANGSMLFIVTTGEHYPYPDTIRYCTYSHDLQQQLSVGIIATEKTLWGFDVNAGIAYVFYYDDNMSVYYKTTTNGVNWSAEQSYSLTWPNPYANSRTDWMQCAVTDQGTPLLVFNRKDYMDVVYPYYSRIYVSPGSGLPCVQVSSTFGAPDTECYYPTIATGGNLSAVLYCMPRNNLADSMNWWDFYTTWSHDNGLNWSMPEKLTSALTNRPGFQQLAKRINPDLLCAYFIYAIDLRRNIDPYWCYWHGSVYNPVAIYLGTTYFPAVQENLDIMPTHCIRVNPSLFRNSTRITLSRIEFDKINASSHHRFSNQIKIYNSAGQLVKKIKPEVAGNNILFNWDGSDMELNEVPSGQYFVMFEDRILESLKLIKIE